MTSFGWKRKFTPAKSSQGIYLSSHPSIYLSLQGIYFSIQIPNHSSIYPFIYPSSIQLSINPPSIHPSNHLTIYLSIHVSFHPYIYLFILHLSIHLSFYHLSLCPSILLFIYLSINLSYHRSVSLTIYLTINLSL